MNEERPSERLATTDETGKRIFIYPAAVTGRYKNRKPWVHGFLILFFLLLPWVRIGDRQLLLLDVARREFSFFGLHLRAHDAPLLVFLVLGFLFLMGFVTVIWGRVWCGWACPQTVFIDSVYRRIETWIEGSHRERRALDAAPWTSAKVAKKALKYAAFLFVSLIVTHSFLAYFVGSRDLLVMIRSSPLENWPSFLVIAGTTAVILFDFGWFREQFCVIMCPYGRFQSVMLDSDSQIVGYDVKRGEPRRNAATPLVPHGDCVNCLRCVQVCPTGIDIRQGLQMECIGCTACIDACDAVMEKIEKPKGLIRYTSQTELAGEKPAAFRPRPYAYALLVLLTVGGLAFALRTKDFLDTTVLRASDAPYQLLETAAGKLVVNHFRLDLSNQTGAPATLQFSLDAESAAAGAELVMPMNPLALPDRAKVRADFFLRIDQARLEGGRKKIRVLMQHEGSQKTLEVTLVGPGA